MEGKKILVTGPTGQVAFPLACTLAKSNEVWGAARFSDAKKKAALEAAGVTCVATDLGSGEFDGLPTDFDYVLHLAVARGATPDFDGDLRANAEAAGLLMAHCRRAKAFLHCSTTGVYQPKDHEPIVESDPLGDNHRVMMPTYSIAKIAAEAVVRYAARQLGLPTVIARLNTPYGNNGGWMYYHLLMMKNGVDITVHSDAPSVYADPRGRHRARLPGAARAREGAGRDRERLGPGAREHRGVVRVPGRALRARAEVREDRGDARERDERQREDGVARRSRARVVEGRPPPPRRGASPRLARRALAARAQPSVDVTKSRSARRVPGGRPLKTSPMSGRSW